jgi:hypothetical protein
MSRSIAHLAILLGAFILSGCFAEVLTTTAITGELQKQQLGAMERQLKGAAKQTGKVNLQRAVDTYYAEKGQYPETLEELAPGYVPSVPTLPDGRAYAYDPETGRVTEPGADNADSGANVSMAAIRQAINAYGMQTGYYPPTLDALYPDYLPERPRTPAGESYLYNNQNGTVSLPNTSGGGSGGAAGVGATGELMTGVGIQNQLNSMGQSGVNSAGTRSRGGVQETTDAHSQRQEDALQALGF